MRETLMCTVGTLCVAGGLWMLALAWAVRA